MRLTSVSLQVTCYISSLAATSDASPVLGEVPLPNTFTLMILAGLLMTSYILLQTGSYIITLAVVDCSDWSTHGSEIMHQQQKVHGHQYTLALVVWPSKLDIALSIGLR